MDKLSRIIDTVLSDNVLAETVDYANIILEEFNFKNDLGNIVNVAKNHIKKSAIDIMEDGIINGTISSKAGKEVIKAIIENDGEIHRYVGEVMVDGGKLDGLKRIDHILSENVSEVEKKKKIQDLVYSGKLCEDELDVLEEDVEPLVDYDILIKKPLSSVVTYALANFPDLEGDIREILSFGSPDNKKKEDILYLCGIEPKVEVKSDRDDPVGEFNDWFNTEFKERPPSTTKFEKPIDIHSSSGILNLDGYDLSNFPIIGKDSKGVLLVIKLNNHLAATKLGHLDRIFNKLFELGNGKIKYEGYNVLLGPHGEVYDYGTAEYRNYVYEVNLTGKTNYNLAVMVRSIYNPQNGKYTDLDSLIRF